LRETTIPFQKQYQTRRYYGGDAARMKVGGDWSYIYFLVPSICSFFFSCSVIYKVTANKSNLKKKFHQLTLLIAVFDFIQCFSWFLGPRYEKETVLCHGQEYLFQIGSLGQGITAVIICTTISTAIQSGKVPTWRNQRIMPWIIFLPLCIIFSIAFNTATLFCPFNKHHELYHPNITRNAPVLPHLICYILCYLLPLLICVIVTLWHTIRSMYAAYCKSDKAIFQVAQQLKLYPLVLIVCVSPIGSYFLATILSDQSSHPLLFVGAILACSSGMINGLIYFIIIQNSKERPYATHHFQGQASSSLLMTGSNIPTNKDGNPINASSKKKTIFVAEEDRESSFGYYANSNSAGSSAISDPRILSSDDDLFECNTPTLLP
jgi:hypothetical protein